MLDDRISPVELAFFHEQGYSEGGEEFRVASDGENRLCGDWACSASLADCYAGKLWLAINV